MNNFEFMQTIRDEVGKLEKQTGYEVEILFEGKLKGNQIAMASRDKIVIGLSFMIRMPMDEVVEVILHEFGHVVTLNKYSGKVSAHGFEWQKEVRKLGGNPSRLYHGKFVNPIWVR